jgi:hypothetical protein
MKIKTIQTKLKLILLTLLSATALNLPVHAQEYLYVDGTPHAAESGTTYTATYGYAALTVTGNGGSYTGTDITLINSIPVPQTTEPYGASIINQGQLSLTNSNITAPVGVQFIGSTNNTLTNVTIDAIMTGVTATQSTLELTGGNITLTGMGSMGINLAASTATVSGVNIDSEAYSLGVNATQGSTLTLADSAINTAYLGVVIDNNSSGILNNVNITTTGENARALHLNNSSAEANLNNKTFTGGITAEVSSTLTLTGSNGTHLNGDITSNGSSTVNLTLTGAGTELHGNFIQDANVASVINLTLGAGTLLEGGGTLDSLTLENGVTIDYTGLITVTDSIDVNGTVTIDFSELTATGDYDILDWSAATGNVNVAAANYNFTGAGVEGTFVINMESGQLTFNATAVPEPSTYFLMGAGLGALLLAARCRRKVQTNA